MEAHWQDFVEMVKTNIVTAVSSAVASVVLMGISLYLTKLFKEKPIRERVWYRYIVATWAVVECFLYAGPIFGWSSLVYVLKLEGIYEDVCPNRTSNTNSFPSDYEDHFNLTSRKRSNISYEDKEIEGDDERGCDEQGVLLALVFTVATAVLSIGSVVLGQIDYRFGTRWTRFFALFTFVPGALMVGFTSRELAWLLFPGASLMAVGGIAYFTTNVQISLLFPVGGATVVGFLSGAFDSSSGVMILVKLAYEHGISRPICFFIFAGLNVGTLVNTFFFLPKYFFEGSLEAIEGDFHKKSNEKTEISIKKNHTSNGHGKNNDSSNTKEPKNDVLDAIEDGVGDALEKGSQSKPVRSLVGKNDDSFQGNGRSIVEGFDGVYGDDEEAQLSSSSKTMNYQGASEVGAHERSRPNGNNSSPESGIQTQRRKLSQKENGSNHKENADEKLEESSGDQPLLRDCVVSSVYIPQVAWISILQLNLYFFLEAINERLERMLPNNEAAVSFYTNMLMYIQLGGFFCAPIAGIVYGWQLRVFSSYSPEQRAIRASVLPLSVTTLLSIVMRVLLFKETVAVLYPVFALAMILRGFLYAMHASYLTAVFPTQYMVFLFGVSYFFAGLATLTMPGLFQWALTKGFTEVNIFLLVLVVLTIFHPAIQWWNSSKAEPVRKSKKKLEPVEDTPLSSDFHKHPSP